MGRFNICVGCGEKTRSRIHEIFNIFLCHECTYHNNNYKCIGITRIRREFRLNDNDLSKLHYISKINRIHGGAPQRIYSKRQIMQVAEGKRVALNYVNKMFPMPTDEASNDGLEKTIVTIKKRRFQRKFRDKLYNVYKGKCAISNVQQVSVLQASHIDSHARTGNNSSVNGLLLRADLHHLFDCNLLLVHPQDLTVRICPSIVDTEYIKYNGIRINERIDGKSPDRNLLKKKWNSATWLDESEKIS